MAVIKYKIRLDHETLSFIRHLHPEIKKRIRMGFEEILKNPSSGKALQNELSGLLSFRVQRFRIVYQVSGCFIDVLGVGHRETIYLETLKAVRMKKKS